MKFWLPHTFPTQFVLIKPLSDGTIARCVVNKSFDEDGKPILEDDELWRIRNLYSLTSKKVLGFTIDGVPMIKPVPIAVPDEEKLVGLTPEEFKKKEEVKPDGST